MLIKFYFECKTFFQKNLEWNTNSMIGKKWISYLNLETFLKKIQKFRINKKNKIEKIKWFFI